MKCLVVLCGLMAVASANPGAVISYSYANPAGVTFRGTGVSPAVPVSSFPSGENFYCFVVYVTWSAKIKPRNYVMGNRIFGCGVS